VLYASTHEMPLYPGTGAHSERGEHGTIVNAPLRAGDGTDVFRDAFESAILPRLAAFAPDLVIISAGFDAHWRDPLANINLKEADFAWATQKLMEIADRHADGRLVSSILEGGYDLEGPVEIDRRPCHGADAGLNDIAPGDTPAAANRAISLTPLFA
jgi:acetoin utilization deacetylase AcuC-like enzyme